MTRVSIFIAVLGSLLFACPLRAATPEEVDKAIDKAKAYLYSVQQNGNWEEVQTREPVVPGQYGKNKADQWGGVTGIVTYALLAAGDHPSDEHLKPAIDFLKKADLVGNYALAMRCQVWQSLPPSTEIHDLARHDGQAILDSMKTRDPGAGFFHYYRDPNSNDYDHSVSQYAVLALWACDQSGFEVPTNFWSITDQAWRNHQYADGAWSYKFKWGSDEDQKERTSMTAAGVATLFITQEYLHLSTEPAGNVSDRAIEAGMKWLGDRLSTDFNGNVIEQYVGSHMENGQFVRGHPFRGYVLYGLERIGVAGGYKYFGSCNWYQAGADYLIHNQEGAGNWQETANTAYDLLFLVRGRGPVLMNKLKYNIAPTRGATASVEGDWNERPRDAANISRWVGKELEDQFNWQVVPLTFSESDLHDSPILYISGDKALSFTADEQAKLKKFVEDGGLIFANADGGNKLFVNSFHALGAALFPDYEFRELPEDHLIYHEQFNRKDWKNPPSVLSLSNGARELMMVVPTADMAKAWAGHLTTRKDAFEFTDNLYLYASEHQNLRKGNTYLVARDDSVATKRTLKVARLQYGGNWDPEPGGWRRVTNQLHNRFGVDLQVDPVKPGDGKLSGYAVAHLTGTAKFSLSDAARDELKTFVNNGGILLIDAAGGSPAFAKSTDELCAALFPDSAAQLADPMKSDNPMFSIGGRKDATASYRRFAKKTLGSTDAPQLRGIALNDHIGVFVSHEDLSVGMVGQPIDGITGYTPESTLDVMDSILMYAASRSK